MGDTLHETEGCETRNKVGAGHTVQGRGEKDRGERGHAIPHVFHIFVYLHFIY